MGRSRSRRRRGKSGGQGSGGSGKGKGTGGSRGRSSGTRGGAGSGGSGKGKGTGGSRGRSNNTRGGQSTANRNQNKKARRTVKSVKKAISKVSKNVSKSVRNVTRGLAAKAGTHLANSQYNKKLQQANWTKRDLSKLTPQQQRHYARLSKITGRDYSTRIPGMRINLSADALARLGKFQDSGWYKGLTKAFPGIKSLKINKQLYSNPLKKGWHSSQRTGRGQGLNDIVAGGIPGRRSAPHLRGTPMPENRSPHGDPDRYTTGIRDFMPISRRDIRRPPHGIPPRGGPERDWLSELYSTHNINQGKLDQGARDYWSKAAETQGRDAVMRSIIGTSKAEGTYGGRKKPQRITTGSRRRGGGTLGAAARSAGISLLGSVTKARRAKQKHDLQAKGQKRRMAKSLAAHMAARGGI